jgi:hypothetical protein
MEGWKDGRMEIRDSGFKTYHYFSLLLSYGKKI